MKTAFEFYLRTGRSLRSGRRHRNGPTSKPLGTTLPSMEFWRFRNVFPAWALLVSFANAASHISADMPGDVWFGWPFVFYGNATRFSTELTIYAWPMLLSVAVDLVIAAAVFAPIYSRLVPERLKKHIFNFSVISAALTAFFFWIFCVEMSSLAGPRGRLESSLLSRPVIGPRNDLNPIV